MDRKKEVEALVDRLPIDPGRVAPALRETPEGCSWLMARWRLLRAALAARGHWTIDEFSQALHLLGRSEQRHRRDLAACRLTAAHLAAESGRSADRAAAEGTPAAEQAREWLDRKIAREVLRLREARVALRADRRRDVAQAADRVLFDPSPVAALMRRYEAAAMADLGRCVSLLARLRGGDRPGPGVRPAVEASTYEPNSRPVSAAADRAEILETPILTASEPAGSPIATEAFEAANEPIGAGEGPRIGHRGDLALQSVDVDRIGSPIRPDLIASEGRQPMPRIPGLAVYSIALFLVAADVPPRAETQPPSFVNDVVPALTRLGCNSGGCHGKLAGQGGFKLSLRGYAPELDHIAITRDAKGRRIAKSRPRESLLLAKPLMRVPHQGGLKLKAGSPEYQTLLAWIAAGTPGPSGKEPVVTRLVIEPPASLYEPGRSVALKVLAHDSGGGVRDVTRLALFKSNEAGLAEVDEAGTVKALRPGATSVMASFMGEVAVHVVTTPYAQDVASGVYEARSNFIDDHVMARLKELRLEPSPAADDATFLRRVTLDLTGSLPSADEAASFLDEKSPDKRASAVNRLLESPAFVDYWAMAWGELFQNRRERDQDKRGKKGVRGFAHWLRDQVRENRPWDEVVRDVLTARGPLADEPAGGYFLVNRKPEDVAEAAAQAILGTRIQCAKCHNHPLERYTQDDYYGMAAFFSRVKLDGKQTDLGPAVDVGNPGRRRRGNGEGLGITQPRTGKFLPPRPLDRSISAIEPGSDPRESLATWMTAPGNRLFARSIVNRVWKKFFAVGLVEPVDDLRATNPSSNEPLLEALCDDFVSHKYDLKRLMRLIVESRTYALSSEAIATNAADRTFFSHYFPRRLPAEVLADALAEVSGVPETYEGQAIGIRAVQLPDPEVRNDLLDAFGRPGRVTACACERTADVTMPQVLHLMNGENLNRRLGDADGRLASLVRSGKTDREIADSLFLAAFSRRATEAQWQAVKTALAEGDDRSAVFRDLAWALVNSKEFLFGH